MLFKYLPSDRLDVLENLKIRFTPLKSLNDPYESLFLFNTSDLESVLISNVSDKFDKLLNEADPLEKTPDNLRKIEAKRASIINDIKSNTSCDIGNNLIDLLGDEFGVLSMSRTNKSLLMWAHYASDNTGFVIGFDKSHVFLNSDSYSGNITHPTPVIYSSAIPKIETNKEDWYQKLLCSKHLEWAYEEEERVFRALMNEDNSIGVDQYGAKIILHQIPVESISAIYLGSRASQETRNKIKVAVDKHCLKCNVYESTISRSLFKIEFIEVSL